MTTSRKDYERAAAAIAPELLKGLAGMAGKGGWSNPNEALAWKLCAENVALNFADVFARDNPRFDRARFLQACGVTP